jgi:hypothetical protein
MKIKFIIAFLFLFQEGKGIEKMLILSSEKAVVTCSISAQGKKYECTFSFENLTNDTLFIIKDAVEHSGIIGNLYLDWGGGISFFSDASAIYKVIPVYPKSKIISMISFMVPSTKIKNISIGFSFTTRLKVFDKIEPFNGGSLYKVKSFDYLNQSSINKVSSTFQCK